MTSLYLSCLLKALSSNTVTMGLGFQHVNFAGTQFSPLQRIFRETISGRTQISKSRICKLCLWKRSKLFLFHDTAGEGDGKEAS